jgi:endonuclease III
LQSVTHAADVVARPNRTREIALLLAVAYGPRPWRRHLPPVDELVATILSQHTSDINTDRAFRLLRARFPSWRDVIAAPTPEVVDAIRGGGLAELKAPRIQSALATLLQRFGSFALDSLAELPVPEARAVLTSISGVGPKTASCVLLFSLGMPALPVDTHVHRVTRRIGLIPDRMNADASHPALEESLGGDRDEMYAFHMHLIHHGRTVCAARRPLCGECALAHECDYVKFH